MCSYQNKMMPNIQNHNRSLKVQTIYPTDTIPNRAILNFLRPEIMQHFRAITGHIVDIFDITPFRLGMIFHFAKCKSYPSHFLAITCSALKPGLPYVNGRKNHHPPIVTASTTPLAAQSASILCPLMRSLAGTTTLLPPRSLFLLGVLFCVCCRKFSSRPTGSRLKTNSSSAPVTRADARCAGK